MRRVLMGMMIASLFVGVAQAQGLPSVCRSFQLLPFIDVLTLAIRQPFPQVDFYIIAALWEGGAEYEMRGGATVTGPFIEAVGGTFTLSNVHESFFDGNPLCNLRVHTAPTGDNDLPEWTVDCLGPNPPFIAHGELQEVVCDGPLRETLRTATGGALVGRRP